MLTGNGREKTEGKRRLLYLVPVLIFAICLAGCLIWLAWNYGKQYLAGREMDRLRDSYVVDMESAGPETLASLEKADGGIKSAKERFLEEYGAPEKTIDFAGLQERENKDIYAWITIPDTPVDYPVLQHPEEPDYYLAHNADGSRGYPGCIYTELYNSRDWEDANTVLYGHNMKNGAMFGSLYEYSDADYLKRHPYVYVYTEDSIRVYEVFAAYEFTDSHLVLDYELNSPEAFARYIDEIYKHTGPRDNINKDLAVTEADKLLTLSTCIKNKPEERYLVQAKLVAEER